LLLAGVAASFDSEVDRTLDQMGARHWMIDRAATGPFFGARPMPQDAVERVRAVDGVRSAEGEAFYPFTIATPGGPESVTLLGVTPGGLGAPTPNAGRPMERSGELLAEPVFGMKLNQTIDLGGRTFTVVGTFDNSSMLGGRPNVFMSLEDLQAIAYKGAPLITSVVFDGTPSRPIDDLVAVDRSNAHTDLVRPLQSANDTILLLSILLWIVAGCIIASVIYLSALERVRDFAVLKAIGVSQSWTLGGLVVQSLTLAVAASAAAIVLARLLSPSMSVPVSLPSTVVILVPVIAVGVSLLASLAGVRRAVRVDPALAFA
jgi:putative ABC transport system permease protein